MTESANSSASSDASCVATAVYVVRKNHQQTQLLFLRRSGGRMAGRWWPVTGTRDAGESPARCALRELHEETALSPITLYRTNLTFPVEGGGHLRIFVAAVETGATVTLNWEHDDYRWCYPQEVADLAGDFVTPIMQEAIRIVEAQPSNLKVTGEWPS